MWPVSSWVTAIVDTGRFGSPNCSPTGSQAAADENGARRSIASNTSLICLVMERRCYLCIIPNCIGQRQLKFFSSIADKPFT